MEQKTADEPDTAPVDTDDSLVEQLRVRLQNRFFAIIFGFAIGIPLLLLFYVIGGPEVFSEEGKDIDWDMVLFYTPINIVFILGMNYFAGWLKRSKGWRTNYTRKVTHISNFTFLMVLTHMGDYTATTIFGVLMIIYGVVVIAMGDGNIFYEAVAREQDAPYRAFYLIIPSVATAIAVLANRTAFGEYAEMGYLVAGWGDAVGEPIGVRFGKHRYKVPTLTGIACTRSYEGSAAVFVMSTFAAAFSMVVILDIPILLAIGTGFAAGIGATIVEGVSPHGVDNFTIQVASVAIAYAIAGLMYGYTFPM